MSALFEAVPNFSEGRDLTLIDDLIAAAKARGAHVLHHTSDPAHHRSVVTIAGTKNELVGATVAMAAIAAQRIDLCRHRGAHPRMGALDVLPFVPLRDATLEDAVSLAKQVAARIWYESAIPSILYGAAASAEHRRDLALVRAGEFEGLAAKFADPRWAPDFGTPRPHPSAGAIAIGARAFLIAFNVDLATPDITVAGRIARSLRAKNGGLRTLKTLAFRLDDQRVQVSFNVTDYRATPLYRITELVRAAAGALGVRVLRTQLIGLAPLDAIVESACYYAGSVSPPPAIVFPPLS